jgi:hypothetical protein
VKRLSVLIVILGACGGPSAERPLDVPVGVARDRLPAELRRFEYCEGDGGGRTVKEIEAASTQMFPRCKVTGSEYGESWVIAHYDRGGRTVRLQRWERFADEQRGLDRFNALVEQRSKRSPPTEEAKALVSAQQDLPVGTRTWVAFRAGDRAVVGVYLLEPRPPQHATVLEEILELR